MSGTVDVIRRWPALAGRWPTELGCSRAVWGKAHGAISDYRWLAASRDLDLGRLDLWRRLTLGLEDRPSRLVAWRRLDGLGVAVGGYPSRAADAAGRRGFLEKGVLVTPLEDDVPAAVASLVLLPPASGFDDAVWWSKRDDPAWRDGSYVLPLEPSPAVPVAPEAVAAAVATGLQQLRAVAAEADLAAFYAALLAGARPAVLPLAAPLPAEALAALLLPLPRDVADRLSLAGWLPASRGDLAELASRWDVVVLPVDFPRASAAVEPDIGHLADGERLAAALWRGDPGLLASPAAPAADFTDVAGVAEVEAPAAEPLWEAWTAAMYTDLARTTDRLVALGFWEAWRRQAVLGPVERSRCAVAWLGSSSWSRADVEPPAIETWETVLEEAGTLGSKPMALLCSGLDGRHAWPWIPGHEERQLRALGRRTVGSEAIALLRHSLEPERLGHFDGIVGALGGDPTSHAEERADSATEAPADTGGGTSRLSWLHRAWSAFRRFFWRGPRQGQGGPAGVTNRKKPRGPGPSTWGTDDHP